jgi:N-acetylglutamate synthase-like GNAT family acetyltransferase
MIRQSTQRDIRDLCEIVNDAAQAYKGVIPADRWHEPYMPMEELHREISAGVDFWVYEDDDGKIAGVMGIQPVKDVTLIRHAYVRTMQRRGGIGTRLLHHLLARAATGVLIGTWKDATWAITFYEKNGFSLVTAAEKNMLLKKYWDIPDRQVATSVVLADKRWLSENRPEHPGKKP